KYKVTGEDIIVAGVQGVIFGAGMHKVHEMGVKREIKANEELAKQAKETLKANRLAMFANVEVDSTKAQELVDKYLPMANFPDDPMRNVECEIIAPETTSAETIKSESFSTADFFEEYSIARNLSKEYIDFGRKLISR
ncbi:MAG: hypothetical protein AABY22_07530, partial [Nanoarchaeota archaeon]